MEKGGYMKKLICVLAMAMTFSGCATIFNDNMTMLNATSEPEGAMVYINGSPRGKTPAEINVYDKEPVDVVFRMDGYEDVGHTIGTCLDKKWLILNFPIYGHLVDAATGKFYGLKEKKVHGFLVPIDKK